MPFCRRVLSVTLASLLALACVTFPALPARADTVFMVNSTADPATGSAANCAPTNAGTCTLRDAIAAANATTGATVAFAIFSPVTLAGPLTVSSAMTIQGKGVAVTGIVAGSASYDVFDVTAGGPVAFSGVGISSGYAGINLSGTGGVTVTASNIFFNTEAGIANDGGGLLTVSGSSLSVNGIGIINGESYTAAITDSTIAQNGKPSGIGGGGIFNNGTMSVTNSLIAQNSTINGAGIYNLASLTVTNSTIVGNTASVGGGILNDGALTVTNSTIAGNTASDGGGIDTFGDLTLVNDTLAGNGASHTGGNLKHTGPVDATNTLIVDSTSGGDLNTALTTSSHTITGAFAFADPDPTRPQDHGGPTKTLALPPGSPAIDGGDDAVCNQITGIAPVNKLDQRGIARPQGAHCDIGAFESQGFALTPATGSTPQSAFVGAAFTNPLAVTLSANDIGVPVNGLAITFTAGPGGSGQSATLSTPNPATTDANGRAGVQATANSIAGAYTVTAHVPGVTDATFNLTNTGPRLTLAPANLPSGVAEQVYRQQLTASATGSTGPVTFTVTAGALPTGLILDSNGLLHGTPTVAGSFVFTVTATDAYNFTGTQQYTLSLLTPTITLSPTTLPNGVRGSAYPSTILSASGGLAPYAFSVTTGALPQGLTLDAATGQLSGTPTAVSTSTFIVTATDVHAFTGTHQYTITVTAAPVSPVTIIAVTPASMSLKVGQAQQFTATATYRDGSTADVTNAVTWSSDNGHSASVDSTGRVTGISAGTAQLTATLGGVSGQATVTVTATTGAPPGAAPASRPIGAGVPSAPAASPAPAPTGR